MDDGQERLRAAFYQHWQTLQCVSKTTTIKVGQYAAKNQDNQGLKFQLQLVWTADKRQKYFGGVFICAEVVSAVGTGVTINIDRQRHDGARIARGEKMK